MQMFYDQPENQPPPPTLEQLQAELKQAECDKEVSVLVLQYTSLAVDFFNYPPNKGTPLGVTWERMQRCIEAGLRNDDKRIGELTKQIEESE